MNYPVGTILKRPLTGLPGWFCFHWGVYVGEGKVIHFNGLEKKSPWAVLRLDSVEGFREGQSISVVEMPADERRGQEIGRRAYQALNDRRRNGFDGRYCFFTNNCQDFCVWCQRKG